MKTLKEEIAERKAMRERAKERKKKVWQRRANKNQNKKKKKERREAKRAERKARKEDPYNRESDFKKRKRYVYPQNPDHPYGTKKDGTPKKKPGAPKGKPHEYPDGSYNSDRHKKRINGYPQKRGDAKNHQEITFRNPRGAGKPRRQLSDTEIKNKVRANQGTVSTELVVERALNFDPVAFQHLDGFYDSTNSGYTAEEKLASIAVWLVTNSFAEAERQTGVKATTLSRWRKEASWFPAVKAELQRLATEHLEAQAYKALDLGMGTIVDRLQNGNIKIKERKVKTTDEETGEEVIHTELDEVRHPITLTEAVNAVDKTHALKDKIQGNITGEVAKDINTKLDELKTRFRNMVDEKVVNPIEVIEHDEM